MVIFKNNTFRQVAIIANGELELDNQDHIQKIRNCQQKIAADGGLNNCTAMKIEPTLIIGDLDSVYLNFEMLKMKYPQVHVIKLDRAKDKTDLEEAIEHANIANVERVIIFGGLGNRIDHSLTNIFLLLRFPGKLFLETAKEQLFAIDAHIEDFELECSPDQVLTLIPIYGEARDVYIEDENETYFFPSLNNKKATFSTGSLGKKFKINIGHGEVICILGKKTKNEVKLPEQDVISTSFTLQQPFRETLRIIRHACEFPHQLFVMTDSELMFVLNESFKEWSLPEKYRDQVAYGTTVSFIPFNGPAEVTINGFKWQGSLSLSKSFLGVSNIALSNSFSVKASSGTVLCIVNRNLIDHEMLQLKDKTSTAFLDNGTADSVKFLIPPIVTQFSTSVWR